MPTKAYTAKAKVRLRLKALSLQTLKDVTLGIFRTTEPGSETVLVYCLDELERRMPEREFVEFCESVGVDF